MKKAIAVISVILVLLLSGCSMTSLESSNIMSPPKATGNKADIQKLIDKQTSGNYTLKYPKNGSIRSSIILHNLDDDVEEEAIAFYSDKEGDHIHALFCENDDDEYIVLDDIILEASNVDRIDFADINGDDTYEILIGYSTSTSSQNILNIYSYNKKIKKLNATCMYTDLVCGDFNSDRQDDILLISLFSGDTAAQAKLMIYNNDGGLSELSSVELDSDITHLASTTYGQIAYGKYGAVIDGITSVGDYTTQIILFDASQPALLNPLYIYSDYNMTRRTTQVCSMDFDKDELIDIPICSLMIHDSDEDEDTVSKRIDWSNLDIDSYSIKTAKSSIICPGDGYLLTMPSKWNETVTARYNSKKRETTVYAYEFSSDSVVLTDEIITVKAFLEDDFDKDSSGYIEFLSTGSTVYAYSIGTSDSYLSITGDEVASLFSLVNQ